MAALSSELRRQLENVVVEARDVAEAAAQSALKKRAVDVADPFPHFNAAEKEQRKRLRARGRQVGDIRDDKKDTQSIDQLTQELAYEFWHRMLFARFLAENNLLMHPSGVPVTLDECNDLAPSAEPPAPNGFVLAARYASTMLPQIFRTDDVLLEIEFAPEQRLALEKLLAGLPRQTFLADDSLGWVYQFWQTKKKKEVNDSGDNIDGRTLPAVTQLFTEHYMVQFLLHNTIGAWWCSRHGIQGPAGGAGVPTGQAPVEMEYLRWRDDGTPAAGTFDGWPKTFKEFTMLDPCCGSGHFLVAGFNLLVPLRMHDDQLSAQAACEAVLRDNLFGLELDPRCTQIAAFALALAAWKYPGEDGEPLGYRLLPQLHIACSGQGVAGKKDDWLALANGDITLRNGMERLYELFEKAPHLGSLIDPQRQDGDLFTARYAELDTLLRKALAKHAQDADLSIVGVVAQGITAAADLLARQYTLVLTNVPYLGWRKQEEVLQEFLTDNYEIGKYDLAAAFVMRCLELCNTNGTVATVTPQNWLSKRSYADLRNATLSDHSWNMVARLGPRAFQAITGEVVNVALLVISQNKPKKQAVFSGVSVTRAKTPHDKAAMLLGHQPATWHAVLQASQLKNPSARLRFGGDSSDLLLEDHAHCYQGISTGDNFRFVFFMWESNSSHDFDRLQGPPSITQPVSGLSFAVRKQLFSQDFDLGTIRGEQAWSKQGVAISETGSNYCSRYLGHVFPNTTHIIIPSDVANIPAIWCFAESGCLSEELRAENDNLAIGNGYITEVPFDLAHWQTVAAEKYPNGLPEPHSDDPTQWLFKGDITTSTDPLQVAVARLLGYRWPDQPKKDPTVDPFVDDDGIVCIPALRTEAPAAERLRELLRVCYGQVWSDAILTGLLTNAGGKAGDTLEDWLRNKFFEQHCKLFHQRPFIWHIWDGRKDGFSALVNYHKLNHKTLENLTFSYLGDWITAQAADAKATKTGADLRLKAAQDLQEQLKLILAGEPVYDIFVRWKPLSEQSVGWNPDLNDGVRMNIRPFVEAGVLRKNPNIKWAKDRGKEPKRDKDEYPWFWSGTTFTGDRVNDIHLTNAVKTAARARKKGAK